MKTENKRLKRLVKESFIDEAQDVAAQESIVVLTFREMVEVIMLTVAAMKSDDVFIAESHNKGKKRFHISKRSQIR